MKEFSAISLLKEERGIDLDILDPVIPEGVVTLEKVHVRLYRHKKQEKQDR